MNIIQDKNLAKSGHEKINWVKSYMPVLSAIEKEFEKILKNAWHYVQYYDITITQPVQIHKAEPGLFLLKHLFIIKIIISIIFG